MRAADDTCVAVRERLNACRDGELTTDGRARVEAHLRRCEDCRAADARLDQLARVLDAWPAPPVPDGLAERTMARAAAALSARTAATAPARTRTAHAAWAAAAAVLVGLLTGAAMANDTWRRRVQPVSGDADRAAADGSSTFRIDYLGDSPDGSLVQAYWSMGTDVAERGD